MTTRIDVNHVKRGLLLELRRRLRPVDCDVFKTVGKDYRLCANSISLRKTDLFLFFQ